jgi:hypothetical protein
MDVIWLKVFIMLKTEFLLPCAAFFSDGQIKFGFMALLMQLSLVYWPAAVRWSRRSHEQLGVQQMLAAFSIAYQVPSDPYAAPKKRFRPTV